MIRADWWTEYWLINSDVRSTYLLLFLQTWRWETDRRRKSSYEIRNFSWRSCFFSRHRESWSWKRSSRTRDCLHWCWLRSRKHPRRPRWRERWLERWTCGEKWWENWQVGTVEKGLTVWGMELSPRAAADSSDALKDRGGGCGGGSPWLPDDGDQHCGSWREVCWLSYWCHSP